MPWRAHGGVKAERTHTLPKPHFTKDVRKGLGSVAVDNAALSTSKSGIGLQAVGLRLA